MFFVNDLSNIFPNVLKKKKRNFFLLFIIIHFIYLLRDREAFLPPSPKCLSLAFTTTPFSGTPKKKIPTCLGWSNVASCPYLQGLHTWESGVPSTADAAGLNQPCWGRVTGFITLWGFKIRSCVGASSWHSSRWRPFLKIESPSHCQKWLSSSEMFYASRWW